MKYAIATLQTIADIIKSIILVTFLRIGMILMLIACDVGMMLMLLIYLVTKL